MGCSLTISIDQEILNAIQKLDWEGLAKLCAITIYAHYSDLTLEASLEEKGSKIDNPLVCDAASELDEFLEYFIDAEYTAKIFEIVVIASEKVAIDFGRQWRVIRAMNNAHCGIKIIHKQSGFLAYLMQINSKKYLFFTISKKYMYFLIQI